MVHGAYERRLKCRALLHGFTVMAMIAANTCAFASDVNLWTGRVAVEQAYNDNVPQEQSPDQVGDWITTGTGQVGWERRVPRFVPKEARLTAQGHVYYHLTDFDYFEIEAQTAATLWARVDGLLGYTYSSNQLLYEDSATGDLIFYKENAMEAGFRRRFGAERRLRLEALFVGEWDDFGAANSGRDAFTAGGLWDARYRMSVDRAPVDEVSPRLTVAYDSRNARSDNYDRDAVTLSPGFEVRFENGMAWRVRYDHVWRDYPVPTARSNGSRNSNFDRFDELNQVQTWLTFPLPWDGWSVTPRYRFRDGVYDIPNRKVTTASGATQVGVREYFTVNELAVEIAYGF